MTPIYFDDALPGFARLVAEQWGLNALSENLFLRDVSGRLTFVVLQSLVDQQTRLSLAKIAEQSLGNYVDKDGLSVSTPEELFDDRLRDKDAAQALAIDLRPDFEGEVYVVDRRMVGADWLMQPAPAAIQPQRLVFASIKGGVGRSTALCVAAAHLAQKGQRVLALDMDLEAPGLGNMLLSDDTLPDFGLLDYLVEQALGPLDELFLADMIATSWLGGGQGRVDVIPAIGRRSYRHPANVLGKIARAYLVGAPSQEQGEATGFAEHIRQLLEQIGNSGRYDVILIDARAGLHETSAAPILGIGAEVLLFGLDQPQTMAGYELLLAHLATFAKTKHPNEDDWRERFHFIQGKAVTSVLSRQGFADKMADLVHRYFWPLHTEIPDMAELRDALDAEWDDGKSIDDVLDEPQISVVSILNSEHYYGFDPLTKRDKIGRAHV